MNIKNMPCKISCNHIKEPTELKTFFSVLDYYWNDRKPAIIVTIISISGFMLWIHISKNYTATELLGYAFKKDEFVSTIIQLVTFIAIISIWYRSISKEWEQQLNKYLSVRFTYDGVTRINCRYARLSGESDARGMAQSLAQALHGDRLPIAPSLKEITKSIRKDNNINVHGNPCHLLDDGKHFLHFDVEIQLTEDVRTLGKKPPSDKSNNSGKPKDKDNSIKLKKNQHIQWDYPFDEQSKKILTVK